MDNDRDRELEAELKRLKAEYDGLREEKVRTEQSLSNLDEHLTALRAQAEADYGTSDPVELERLLAERRAENERRLAEYRQHVAAIKMGLAALEEDRDEERSHD